MTSCLALLPNRLAFEHVREIDARGPDWTSIMQAADEPTTDGRKMPGDGRDVDLPGNRGARP